MLQLHIPDLTRYKPVQLRAIARLLLAMAGDELVEAPAKEENILKEPEITSAPSIPESPRESNDDCVEMESPPAPDDDMIPETFEEPVAPPPPPPPATSVAPPPPPPPAAPSVELDKRGLPWDARIHSSSKKFKVDGTWKNLRNLDKEYVKKIEQELLSAQAAPAATTNPEDEPAVVQQPFPKLMVDIAKWINSGKISRPDIIAIAQSHGIKSIPLIATRVDLIPTIRADIEAAMMMGDE